MAASREPTSAPARGDRWGMLPLLWVVFIMVASTSTLWPILTPYAQGLGAGGLGLGLVVGAMYATRLVLGPWIGRTADRHGYRTLLLVGTLLYIPIALAYAGAFNVATLAGARLLHGFGSAIVLPMVMAVLGQHAAGGSGAAMARYNAAQWLGYALGPVAGGLLVARFGVEAVFLLLAPAGVVSALAVLLVDRRYTSVERPAAGSQPVKPPPDAPSRVLLGYNFLVAPASLIVLSFFPLLAQDRGYGPVMIGALLSIASFATAAIQPLWGSLADKTGIRPLLVIGAGGTLASLSLLAAVEAVIVAAVAVLAAGLSIAALVAGVSTAAVETGRVRGMGSYIGLFHSAGSTGQAVMPLAYGVVLGQIGVAGLLPVVGGLVLIGSLAYLASLLFARPPATDPTDPWSGSQAGGRTR